MSRLLILDVCLEMQNSMYLYYVYVENANLLTYYTLELKSVHPIMPSMPMMTSICPVVYGLKMPSDSSKCIYVLMYMYMNNHWAFLDM